MGKKSQSGTSKKNVKSAPTWREKLKEYNINNIYEGRTCEIILMAELTISYTEAIILFHNGATENPTNVTKSINFESLMMDIKQPKQAPAKAKGDKSKSKSKGEPTAALFQSAAAEALTFLNTAQSIPLELIAQLLKLKIINVINEDVTLRDQERILEIEKLRLANEPPDKKEKGKAKPKEKKKGKGKAAAIKLPIEERQLYFVVSGFYDSSLIQELFNIGITLSAVLEISSPECLTLKEKYAHRGNTSLITSNPTLETSLISSDGPSGGEEDEEVVLFINQFYTGSKESVCYSIFGGEQSISSITSSIYGKISELNNFWNTITQKMEGELQAKCLETAGHIRVNPLSAARSEKNPQEIFLEISQEILKISDVKRQHLNYLHNTKICEISSEPKKRPVKFWKTYKELMDVVPSDCFTTGLFLHCLVEEVCGRVPDPKPPQKKKKVKPIPKRVSTDENENSMIPEKLIFPDVNIESEITTEVDYEKVLKEFANYVIQYRKTYTPKGRCGITYRKNKLDPKINLKISHEPFIIHETNKLEYKLHTYQDLSKNLLLLNLNILNKSPSTLLWNLYPPLATIEVVYRNHQLETWRRMLNLSLEDVQSSLSAIQFDFLECSTSTKTAEKPKTSLQILFPEKNESRVHSNATPNIKYIQTPDISLVTLNERESCLRIPEVPYSNTPNIYEAKNMQTYLWYEKLPRKIMVQQLQKANAEYFCFDHKYCPYNDAILLRFHNNLDMFGINSTVWSQSLRTPVCFRDFCKYIIHDEWQWLDREEENYQEKLKKMKKHPIPTEEVKEDTTECRKESIKTMKKDPAPPEEVKEDTTQCRKESIKKFAQPGDPFNFYAYDLGEARIQLTGATTVFNSMDGYKITIDRTSFIGKPNNLSLNASIAGHNFILHYNKAVRNDPFMFHFWLADGTILVFSKPTRKNVPEISMAEKIKISKPKLKSEAKSVYQPRDKKFYYVTEIKRWYLKTINEPAISRKCSCVQVLNEDFMAEIEEQMKRNFSRCYGKKRRRKFRKCAKAKGYVEEEHPPNDSKEVLTLFVSPTLQEQDLTMSKSQAKLNAVLQKIEEAKKLQVPMFKVYSSKLHKFEYIKRIKSNIYIQIGRHTISLPCKHPTYKTSRDIEVVKVFPIKLTDSIFSNNNCYDIKVSLPSGLLLYTLPGINDQPFNIRQKYIETTPYCKNIINEDSRSFMRNGNVVIKNNDGTLDILSVNGQIIHCEIPHSVVQTHTKYRLKTKHDSELSELQSRLCRIVNWRRRHIIQGSEARYFKYRRINLRQHKLEAKKSKQIYVMRKGSNPSFEFTLITHDGKQLKVTNTNVKKQNQFYQTTNTYESYDDRINLRDDGTTNLISDCGIFTTQFNDKTKITSWFAESPELILLEEEDDEFLAMDSMSSIFYDEIINNGWVLVQMFYKFEHPNYATILFSCDNHETEVILPNNVIVNVTENGHYFMDVDRILSSVINDELVYLESTSCDTCMQRNITVVNIKPLYDGVYPIEDNMELLKTCDSYEKIFLVNYNGRCFRNSNFVKNRTNRAECPHHDKEDYQQLFVLNRDLSGRKFWDIKAYRKRIMEATENNNTVLQYYGKNSIGGDYTSLEVRTYKYKPYHMHFINRHLINDYIFKGYQDEPNPHQLAYTTLCHIHSMPKECMKRLLESSMMETKGEFPKPDHKDTLCRCISQIERENIKLKGKSVFDEHLRKVSSALMLLKRWYAWHEFHQPYVPPTEDQLCKCKPIPQQETPERNESLESNETSQESFGEKLYNSIEILPNRVESSVEIEPYKKLYKAVCECNQSTNFICECKPTSSIEENVFPLETESEPEGDLEARKRIASIRNWSNEFNYLDNVYVLAEETISASDYGGASVSDTAFQPLKQPPCKCNDKKLNQRPLAPKRKKVCTDDTCDNQITSSNESNTTVFNDEMHKRQAGGADLPIKYSKIKKSGIKPNYIEKLYRLKQLQKRIIDMVLAAGASMEVSAKKAEHYKVAVAIDIISNIAREQLNTSELSNLLKKLNDVDMNKYKKLPAEQLIDLILALPKTKIKNSSYKSNSPSELTKQHQNITKSTVKTIKSMKPELVNSKKVKPKKKTKTKNI